MKEKMLNTREYISTLRELTEEGKTVSLLISGSSMAPFLANERDTICFEKPKRALKKGDMVFYQRSSGQYVMHRICKITQQGYYMVGDAQIEVEGPLPEKSIFALVTKVKRKGKWIGPKNFWWIFFEHIWILVIPFRKKLLKLYACVRKKI